MSYAGEKKVDSFRFISGFTEKLVRRWIKMEPARETPWSPLSKPLSESKVALLSSSALALMTDTPFDQDRERKDPWWGDPSHRIIPAETRTEDIRIYHLHINPAFGEADINCVMPLDHLRSALEQGRIGSIAPSHYSMMGYIVQPEELLTKTVPAMINRMQQEEVDVLVLVPT